ncbi:MAG TPA: hypothetical protein VKX46_19745 [Ktedonobacteraceae bacterium]|jgi:hypothetical protein|nr:hypothetical protein [Ktedonobacteraceae bacterium]
MNALTNLNNVVTLLQQNAAKIGITAAGLLVAIYCVGIMLNNDNSPAARTERWAQLKKVFLCAAIIAGTGAFVQLATNLGGML